MKCFRCKELITKENFVANKGKVSGMENCCRKCNTARVSEWYYKNKDKKRAYDKQYIKDNREAKRAALKRYRDKHPAQKKAETIARRNGIKLQTPIWANFKYMNLFYKQAKMEQKRTGKEVHVDHIIPLTNPIVCGLHCEDNLQLLFATDNLKKNNHYSLEYLGLR